jgi:hypothetical protein
VVGGGARAKFFFLVVGGVDIDSKKTFFFFWTSVDMSGHAVVHPPPPSEKVGGKVGVSSSREGYPTPSHEANAERGDPTTHVYRLAAPNKNRLFFSCQNPPRRPKKPSSFFFFTFCAKREGLHYLFFPVFLFFFFCLQQPTTTTANGLPSATRLPRRQQLAMRCCFHLRRFYGCVHGRHAGHPPFRGHPADGAADGLPPADDREEEKVRRSGDAQYETNREAEARGRAPSNDLTQADSLRCGCEGRRASQEEAKVARASRSSPTQKAFVSTRVRTPLRRFHVRPFLRQINHRAVAYPLGGGFFVVSATFVAASAGSRGGWMLSDFFFFCSPATLNERLPNVTTATVPERHMNISL